MVPIIIILFPIVSFLFQMHERVHLNHVDQFSPIFIRQHILDNLFNYFFLSSRNTNKNCKILDSHYLKILSSTFFRGFWLKNKDKVNLSQKPVLCSLNKKIMDGPTNTAFTNKRSHNNINNNNNNNKNNFYL